MMNEKHAYLLMVHDDIYTVSRLLRLIDDYRNDIYIHIDKKSTLSEADLRAVVSKSAMFLTERILVYWADFSQVECELLLLKAAITHNYKYYHLLSGSDLPLKSQDEIHNFFDKTEKQFVHFSPVGKSIDFIKYYHVFQKRLSSANRDQRITWWKVANKCMLTVQQLLRVGRVEPEMEIKKGANWFSITHSAANYIAENEYWIKTTFRNTRSSDEFFVQTLLYNSEHKKDIYNALENDDYLACLRKVDWNRGAPYVFKKQDFDELLSADHLFARKFNSTIDSEIIDRLYESVRMR